MSEEPLVLGEEPTTEPEPYKPAEGEPIDPYQAFLKSSGLTDSPDLKTAFSAGMAAGQAGTTSTPELPPDLDR